MSLQGHTNRKTFAASQFGNETSRNPVSQAPVHVSDERNNAHAAGLDREIVNLRPEHIQEMPQHAQSQDLQEAYRSCAPYISRRRARRQGAPGGGALTLDGQGVEAVLKGDGAAQGSDTHGDTHGGELKPNAVVAATPRASALDTVRAKLQAGRSNTIRNTNSAPNTVSPHYQLTSTHPSRRGVNVVSHQIARGITPSQASSAKQSHQKQLAGRFAQRIREAKEGDRNSPGLARHRHKPY